MPDLQIDPGSLSRPSMSSATPVVPSKSFNGASSAQKATKLVGALPPRIDLEPLYMSLKAAIGDNWDLYKESLALFVMGQLSQAELSMRVDWMMISFAGDTENLHNQLIVGIYANISREAPEQAVAPWVSENDKPKVTTGTKPVTGDAAEQRIKVETMSLPARDRRRIKDLGLNHSDAYDSYAASLGDHRKTKLSKTGHEVIPVSAGGLNNLSKTNWDLEIRKRFAQPLASETGEFPDTSTIETRMLPICYENGLVSGHNDDAAHFMSVAAETFIKQFLSSVFDKTRSNGPSASGSAGSGGGANWVMTHKYRRQLEREEEQWLRGEIQRDKSGLLPAEAKAAAERGSLAFSDLRAALELGNCGIGQMPIVVEQVMFGYNDDEHATWNDHYVLKSDNDAMSLSEVDVVMTGMEVQKNGTKQNGHLTQHETDSEADEDDDWDWEGAYGEERNLLNGVLDSVLAG